MLQRFNRFNAKEVKETFKKVGAIIWDENIVTTGSTIDNWTCSSSDIMLKRISEDDNKRPFYISEELAQVLKELLLTAGPLGLRWGLDGPYDRKIVANSKRDNELLRGDWHVDSHSSITIIIPLTEFTINNGSTQLKLPVDPYMPMAEKYGQSTDDVKLDTEIVHFIGSPYKPLLMNGMVTHRQSTNITDKDRDALVMTVDIGAFD